MISLIEDIECPVKCGSCCIDCLHLLKSGCKLQRKERPFECNAYLCGKGTLVLYGETNGQLVNSTTQG